MSTRTATIVTTLGLAAGATLVPTFAGSAGAERPGDEIRRVPPSTEAPFVPTSPPPTTLPVADAAEAPVTVDLDDVAPDRVPVTAPIVERDAEADDLQYEPIAETSAPVKLDPDLFPDPEYLAPCGAVPYNLAPRGPIALADMTGDGSANDRLSIRQVGSGDTTGYRVHLELSDGTRSEAFINAFDGYLPVVSDPVKLWQEQPSQHSAPAADEVLVSFGMIGSTQFWQLFGTDERGCITPYTNEIGSNATVMFRHDDDVRSGWSCNTGGWLKTHEATRQDDGTWDTREFIVRRTGLTTVKRSHSAGAHGLPASANPTFGAGC